MVDLKDEKMAGKRVAMMVERLGLYSVEKSVDYLVELMEC